MRLAIGKQRRQTKINGGVASLSAGALLVGILLVVPAWAQRDCGYDELRCAQGIDRSTCLCIGEVPRPPDPCTSMQTAQQAQQCYMRKVQEVAEACRTSPGWNQARLDWWDSLDVWREQLGLARLPRPRC